MTYFQHTMHFNCWGWVLGLGATELFPEHLMGVYDFTHSLYIHFRIVGLCLWINDSDL